jgi:hypothetical protein
MVDSPDSHFIVQNPASLSSDDGYGFYEQHESSASLWNRIQGYFS